MTLNGESKFWQFNLGHAITISLLAISAIGLYFRVDGRLTAVELLASHNYAAIQLIDAEGTRKSQLVESEMRAQIVENQKNVLWLMSRYPDTLKK